MKKNRFIKLASGLLVLCLMTTCVIGATLAKYTTAKDTQDSARVAKWGVRISAAANSAFKTEYDKDDNSYTKGAVTVKSSSTDKVVAPGTSGSAAQFSISGTPEVAVRLSFAMTDVKEVKLTAGTYTNTDGATVELQDDYMPIKWTLKKNDTHGEGADTNVEGAVNLTLAEMATFLEGYTVDYAPGTVLSTTVPTYKLYWAWTFNVNTDADKADSILGDLAASVSGIKKGGVAIEAADYSTVVSYKLTITATQID